LIVSTPGLFARQFNFQSFVVLPKASRRVEQARAVAGRDVPPRQKTGPGVADSLLIGRAV